MAVRAQMDQTKLRKLNSQSVESTTNEPTTCMVIQSPMEQLFLVVIQFLFHAFSTGDHALLCHEAVIILQF